MTCAIVNYIILMTAGDSFPATIWYDDRTLYNIEVLTATQRYALNVLQ